MNIFTPVPLAYLAEQFERSGNGPDLAQRTLFYLYNLAELGIAKLIDGEWVGTASDGIEVSLVNHNELISGRCTTYLINHALPKYW